MNKKEIIETKVVTTEAYRTDEDTLSPIIIAAFKVKQARRMKYVSV